MSMFDYSTTRETEFKVGDWVRNKIDINEKQMVFGTREASNEEFEFLYFSNNKMGLLQDYELWQPKEGEWCWFYSSNESNPLLAKFDKYDEYSKYYQIDISKYGKHSHPSNHRFTYCEPFTGELPSFIKER